MKTLACGTKQLKTVIAKENLKKPKQTQKKTSEQIVFVGLLWDFGHGICWNLEIWQSSVELQNADWQGQIHDDNDEQGQMHNDWLICLFPWNFKKTKMAG